MKRRCIVIAITIAVASLGVLTEAQAQIQSMPPPSTGASAPALSKGAARAAAVNRHDANGAPLLTNPNYPTGMNKIGTIHKRPKKTTKPVKSAD